MRRVVARVLSIAVTLAAAAAPSAFSESEKATLTLARALEIATEHNSRLRAANEQAMELAAGVDAARAARLPHVSLSVDASRSTNPPLVFGQLLSQEAFTEANFDPAFLNEPDPLTNVQTRLYARQSLWAGGRIGAGVAGARAASASAQAGAERVRQEVLFQVVGAYGDALLARERLNVAEKALESARENARIATDQHEAGLVVRSDVLQARVRESETQQMVVVARSGIDVALAALAFALGLDDLSGWALPEGFDWAALPAAQDEGRRELLEAALMTRPDVHAADQSVAAAQSGVEAARAAWMPEIGVSAWLEADADSFPEADGTNWALMLGARWHAFDGGVRRATIRAAAARERRAQSESNLLRRAVALEIAKARAGVEAAEARLAHARNAVALADENLRIVQDRYREGLTTLVELLDSEASLTRSRTEQATAMRDLLVTGAALDLATGREREAWSR